MNCPACGHTLSSGARFCNKCGTLLSQPPVAGESEESGLPCPKCGHALKPGARFCASCGAALGAPAEESPAIPDEQPVDVEIASVEEPPTAEWPDDVTQPVVVGSLADSIAAARARMDSLPLHPVQRGMPDFELPEPRDNPSAIDPLAMGTPTSASAMAPVGHVSFDDMNGPASSGSGAGIKWLLVAVIALLVVGAGGWWGYRYWGASSAPAGAADAVQPAVDDVADDESVVPSASATGAASGDEAADAVVDASMPAPEPADPVSLTEGAAPQGTSEHTPAFVEAPGAARAGESGASALSGAQADVASPDAMPEPRQERRRPAKQNLDSLLD